MLLQLHPQNPDERKIKQIVECLRDGGVIVYPTDTIYGLGCDFKNEHAVERICRIKNIKPEKANLSFVCNDLSHIADFTRPFGNDVFKLMKRCLPGPFTFILNANNDIPRLLKSKKKTIGIRVPDNNIARSIALALGNPIISTSLKNPSDDFIEYPTDPEDIYEQYEKLVDIVIDGGYGGDIPSTIIDCTGNAPELQRQGLGEL